nr:hypothetical protein [Tanacetum cinerariifolium]
GGDDEQASDEEEFIHPSLSTHAEEETRDEECFDPIPKTPENSDDEGNGEEILGINVGRQEGHDEEEEEDELYRDVNINHGRGIQTTQDIDDSHMTLNLVNHDGQQQSSSMLNLTPDAGMESIFETTSKMDVQTPTSTSYAIAADLFEMELKKILIEKMESNKSIHRSNEQRRLYKALVEAYESDKIILDTYRETHPEWFSQQKKPPTLDRDLNKTFSATHESIQPWISKLAKQSNSRSSFNELIDTPVDFSNFLMNRLRVDTLTPELLAGPTYELLKGSCKSLVELKYHLEEVYKATTDQLDWVNPEGQQYPHNLLKPLPL